jgi:hypothetical protein
MTPCFMLLSFYTRGWKNAPYPLIPFCWPGGEGDDNEDDSVRNTTVQLCAGVADPENISPKAYAPVVAAILPADRVVIRCCSCVIGIGLMNSISAERSKDGLGAAFVVSLGVKSRSWPKTGGGDRNIPASRCASGEHVRPMNN